jgi:hypothetical protein
MGKAIRASALVLLLACSAQAGWMTCDFVPPPPPPSTQSVQEPTADGQEAATEVQPENLLLVRVALNLIALF